MHTDHHKDPLVDLGYEKRDLHPKNIFVASMVFFVFVFVSYAAGWAILHWGFDAFKPVPGVNDLMSNKIPKAPNPILQTNVTAKTDIKAMREHEASVLGSGGASDHTKGKNRISIEQAIKLSAERGAKLNSTGGTSQ